MGGIKGALGEIGKIGGTAVGAWFGGPAGAAVGGTLGGTIGNALEGKKQSAGGAIKEGFGSPAQLYSRNPDWVNNAAQDVYTRAKTAADVPYEQYTGNRVAGLSPNQQSAIYNAYNSVGRFRPTYDTITGYLNQSTNPYTQTYDPTKVAASQVGTQDFTQANLPGYMSPYIKSVLAPQLEDIREEGARDLNALNRRASLGQNFGGSRAALEADLLQRRYDKREDAATNNAYSQAFDKASGLFTSDQDRDLRAQLANQSAGLNADQFNTTQEGNAFNANYNVFKGNQDALRSGAQGLQNLVALQRSVGDATMNNLLKTGALQQQQEQASLNTAYQDFLEKRGYNKEQAAYLANILKNNPAVGSIANGQDVTGNNGIANAASAGMGLFGNLFGGGGSSGGLGGLFGGGGGGGGGMPSGAIDLGNSMPWLSA